jgi:hypothetical protein
MLSDVERSLLAAILLNSGLFKQTAELGQDDFLIDSMPATAMSFPEFGRLAPESYGVD